MTTSDSHATPEHAGDPVTPAPDGAYDPYLSAPSPVTRPRTSDDTPVLPLPPVTDDTPVLPPLADGMSVRPTRAPRAVPASRPARPATGSAPAPTPSRPAARPASGSTARPTGPTTAKKKGKKGKKSKKKGILRGHPLRKLFLILGLVAAGIYVVLGMFGGLGGSSDQPQKYSIPTQIGLMPGVGTLEGVCTLAHQAGGKASSDDIEQACSKTYTAYRSGVAADCRTATVALIRLAWKNGTMIAPDNAQVDQVCNDLTQLSVDSHNGNAGDPVPVG